MIRAILLSLAFTASCLAQAGPIYPGLLNSSPELNGIGTPAANSMPCDATHNVNFPYVNTDPAISGGRQWLCLYNPTAQTYGWVNFQGVAFFNAGGAVSALKCYTGQVTSTATTGAWSLNYTSLGITTIYTVQPTALSTGNTASTLNTASLNSVTATTASGFVTTGNTILSILSIPTIQPQATPTTVYLFVCGV
jgi:hypothetical protein